MGGSKVGHYLGYWVTHFGDQGWVTMGGSRVGYYGLIQGGSSLEDPV